MSANGDAPELLFGRHAVLAYLMKLAASEDADDGNEAAIHKIYFAEGMRSDDRTEKIKRLAKELGIPLAIAPRPKLDRMVESAVLVEDVGSHQGVVAQISQAPIVELSTWLAKLGKERQAKEARGETPGHELLVVLDGIEDPHNLGAIVRVCEASGVKALLLPARRSAGITGAVAKTSAGALAFLPIVRIHNVVRALEDLKKAGFWIAGLAVAGKQSHFEADLVRDLVLVIGNEGHGISRLVATHCDFLVRIPLIGRTESLNASVATGIVVYEYLRQKSFRKMNINENKDRAGR